MKKYKAIIMVLFLSVSLSLFIGCENSKGTTERVDKTIATGKAT